MRSVFLSYSTDDLGRVREIEGALVARGVRVWRDQGGLRAGQNWPTALGEAIAAQDVVLLVWSARAAMSRLVEQEWNAAVALHKTVIPCLLDGTPLPALLQGVQAVRLDRDGAAIDRILAALADETVGTDSAFTVGRSSRRAVYRWSPAVLVALLMAGLGLFLHQPTPVAAQPLAGSISDGGEPIPGVRVSATMEGKVVASGETDRLGAFRFQVAAPADADVTLVAQKDGYATKTLYGRVGNTGENFTMERRRER